MAQNQFWFSVCVLSCMPKSKLPDFKALKLTVLTQVQ